LPALNILYDAEILNEKNLTILENHPSYSYSYAKTFAVLHQANSLDADTYEAIDKMNDFDLPLVYPILELLQKAQILTKDNFQKVIKYKPYKETGKKVNRLVFVKDKKLNEGIFQTMINTLPFPEASKGAVAPSPSNIPPEVISFIAKNTITLTTDTNCSANNSQEIEKKNDSHSPSKDKNNTETPAHSCTEEATIRSSSPTNQEDKHSSSDSDLLHIISIAKSLTTANIATKFNLYIVTRYPELWEKKDKIAQLANEKKLNESSFNELIQGIKLPEKGNIEEKHSLSDADIRSMISITMSLTKANIATSSNIDMVTGYPELWEKKEEIAGLADKKLLNNDSFKEIIHNVKLSEKKNQAAFDTRTSFHEKMPTNTSSQLKTPPESLTEFNLTVNYSTDSPQENEEKDDDKKVEILAPSGEHGNEKLINTIKSNENTTGNLIPQQKSQMDMAKPIPHSKNPASLFNSNKIQQPQNQLNERQNEEDILRMRR
jgi:hypothetical protein